MTLNASVCLCRCEWVCAVSRCMLGGRVCERHGKLQVCVSIWIQEQHPADQLPRWRPRPVVFTLFTSCFNKQTDNKLKSSRSVSPSDIDECQLNVCVNGRCENTPGSYRCVCRLGYRLTGNSCTGTALKPGSGFTSPPSAQQTMYYEVLMIKWLSKMKTDSLWGRVWNAHIATRR